MKKFLILGVLAIIIIIVGMAASQYNSLVTVDEEVNNKWATVQTEYQRRYDLIPNLVETVKGYADFEKSTLTAVTEARAKALSAMQNTDGGKNIDEFNKANTNFVGAMRGLFGYTEQYPDLKANQNFMDLQRQLEGTENRISTARERYNDSVKIYNQKVRKFPMMMFAGMFGFDKREMFESTTGAEDAPDVSFGS